MGILWRKLYGIRYLYSHELVERLVAEASKRGVVLDAGCGSIGLDRTAVGVDLNKESAKKYASRGGRDAVAASLTALPFRDFSFDAVACIDVLEHVKDKKLAVRELCRVGRLIVGCTSNLQNPEMLLDTILPKRIAKVLSNRLTPGFSDGKHCQRRGTRFTVVTLNNAFREAGRVVEVAIFGEIVFKPKWRLLLVATTKLYILSLKLKLPTGEGLLFRSKIFSRLDKKLLDMNGYKTSDERQRTVYFFL